MVLLLLLLLQFQLLKKHCTGVAPEILQFKLQRTCEALEGSVQQFIVNMKEAKSLPALEEAIAAFKPVMMGFQPNRLEMIK